MYVCVFFKISLPPGSSIFERGPRQCKRDKFGCLKYEWTHRVACSIRCASRLCEWNQKWDAAVGCLSYAMGCGLFTLVDKFYQQETHRTTLLTRSGQLNADIVPWTLAALKLMEVISCCNIRFALIDWCTAHSTAGLCVYAMKNIDILKKKRIQICAFDMRKHLISAL